MRTYRRAIITIIATLALAATAACSSKADTSGDKVDKPAGDVEAAKGKDEAPKKEEEEKDDAKTKLKEEVPKAIITVGKKVKGDAIKQGKRYKLLLNEGRKQVQNGDFEAGVKTFRKALEDDPNDDRLLGELSFAALKAMDYKTAERAARDCIRHSRDPKVGGGCHYNLGRAFEEQGNKPKAAASYTRSLEVRPGNKVVQGRLEGLGDVESAAPVATSGGYVPCDGFPCAPVANTTALCKVITTHLEGDYGLSSDEAKPNCDVKASRKVERNGLLAIAILEASMADYAPEVFSVLAMKTEEGWRVAGKVAYVYNPGAFGIYEDASLRNALRDIHEGGAEEVVVNVTIDRHDTDLGIAEEEDTHFSYLKICELRDKGPTCYGTIPLEYRYSRDFIADAGEEMGLEKPKDLPNKERYAFDIGYPGPGKIKLEGDAKKGGAGSMKKLEGTWDLRSLPKTGLDIFHR